MNRPLEEASENVKSNIRVVEATTNKVIIRGYFIGEPGDNNALSAAVRRNRKTIGSAVNHRRKTRAKIKLIHS